MKMLFVVLLPVLLFSGVFLTEQRAVVPPYHDPEILKQYHRLLQQHSLVGDSITFINASRCDFCHGKDPSGRALTDAQGKDVSLYEPWLASMMGNAARDPFWRAKVEQETSIYPQFAGVIEDKCTSCHAPAGRYNHFINQGTAYTMHQLLTDTLGLEGVSCLGCHMQEPPTPPLKYSGEIRFNRNNQVFGPFQQPFAQPMINNVGLEPVFGAHIKTSEACASCHTLITHPVKSDGTISEIPLFEQATYHEWVNSAYSSSANRKDCQSCHFPAIEDPVIVSQRPPFLSARTPFALHDMSGANAHMLGILNEHRDDLGIPASSAALDQSRKLTLRMLQEKTAVLALTQTNNHPDSLQLQLEIRNLAGHKFPSGYPSRRAWVEILVTNSSGTDTLFHSGKTNPDFSISAEDRPFEPHHQVISQESQVQIYEQVIADDVFKTTVVLLAAQHTLKDNRIPPLGFTKGHPVYDTTVVMGGADTDPDFNRELPGQGGTGSDWLLLHLPKAGWPSNVMVHARLYYQSMPVRWMEEVLSGNGPHRDKFKPIFENSDHRPVLVAQVRQSFTITSTTGSNSALKLRVWPNPLVQDQLFVGGIPVEQLRSWEIRDMKGRVLKKGTQFPIPVPGLSNGVYLLNVNTLNGICGEKIVVDRPQR